MGYKEMVPLRNVSEILIDIHPLEDDADTPEFMMDIDTVDAAVLVHIDARQLTVMIFDADKDIKPVGIPERHTNVDAVGPHLTVGASSVLEELHTIDIQSHVSVEPVSDDSSDKFIAVHMFDPIKYNALDVIAKLD